MNALLVPVCMSVFIFDNELLDLYTHLLDLSDSSSSDVQSASTSSPSNDAAGSARANASENDRGAKTGETSSISWVSVDGGLRDLLVPAHLTSLHGVPLFICSLLLPFVYLRKFSLFDYL